MNLAPKEYRFRRLAIAVASRILACLVVLSFFAILVPIGTASAEKEKLMACCVGKKTGHCDSALASKKLAPQHDHNTIVADEDETGSQDSSLRSAAESTAVRKPCSPSCCATSSTVRPQQNRERGTVQAKARYELPAALLLATDNTPATVSANDYWAQISPRGPPAFLL